MRKILVTLSLLVLTITCVLGKPQIQFRDFSLKGEKYKPIEDLRLAVDDLNYLGSEQINIMGRSYAAEKYSVTSNVKVQTLCAIGSVSTEVYETIPSEFEILVAIDTDKAIQRSYVQTIYNLWSKKEVFSGDSFFDFNINDGHYLLTSMPGSVNIEGYYFIWVNGRVIKITFKGFQREDKGGWGVMDSFTQYNLRVKIGDSEVKAYEFPLSSQKRFLKLYNQGFFN